jgi:hypothetical protein
MPPIKSRNVLALYLAIAAVYLLTSSGRVANSDGLAMFNVTQSTATARNFSADPCVPTPRSDDCVPGAGGHKYAGYGLAPSVASVPAYLAGAAAASMVHIDRRFVLGLAVLLSHALFSAAVPAVLALWLSEIGISWSAAATGALVLAFATPFWYHSTKAFYSDAHFALALVACCWLLSRRDSPLVLVAAGACFGFSAASRLYGLVLTPAIVTYAILIWRSRSASGVQVLKKLTWCGAGLSVFLLLIAWANWARFGSIFKTGYQLRYPSLHLLLSHPLLDGMRSLLVNGEVGILPFMPWLLALPFLWARTWRRYRSEAILVLVANLINYLFFSKYIDWHGGNSLGPRLLLTTVPLLVLPLAVLFDKGRSALRSWTGCVAVGLVGLSFLVQLVTAPYPFNRYYLQMFASQMNGRREWWFGNIIARAVSDLPELFSRVIQSSLSDPLSRYIQSLPNPVNLQRPDLWFLKASLSGVPIAVVSLIAIALLLLGFGIHSVYQTAQSEAVGRKGMIGTRDNAV